jgi:hypothetical protein
MGDDLEKFGVWPGTYDHCYRDGWLDHFFHALESCADWLEVATPGAAVAFRQPLGRADLPTASYTEMMEWALPTDGRRRFHALVEELAARPEALPFVARRDMAEFLLQVFRVEFDAQENAARLGEIEKTVPEWKARSRSSRRRASRSGQSSAAARNATTHIGTAFSAASTRRICARRSGVRWCKRKPLPTA